MGRRKPISIEEVKRRVFAVHGDVVRIVPETYVGVRFKATFIDKEHGTWEAWVTNVTQGHGHSSRGHLRSQQTNLEKYGSISPLGGKEVREKIEATNLERYGDKNVLGAGSSLLKKRDQTMLERYGAVNPQQVPEIRERTKATMVGRHGAPHPYQSQEIMERMQASNVEKYGVPNTWQVTAIRDQIRETCIERYGVENPAQDPMIHERSTRNAAKVKQLVHWKTGRTLQCRASYEVTFVEWCNANRIDFDWQIRFKTPLLTPGGRRSVYFVDAFIKDGVHANTYVEIKGTFDRKNGDVGRVKWEWFHAEHPNSELWTGDVLKAMGILGTRKDVVTNG